jgi:hypothetical protein
MSDFHVLNLLITLLPFRSSLRLNRTVKRNLKKYKITHIKKNMGILSILASDDEE